VSSKPPASGSASQAPSGAPPPSGPPGPPGERHSSAIASDGTRLFVRSKEGEHAEGSTRAFLCDGIVCDGFVWKYVWNDLAPILPLTHWHYRGHGRSARPRDAGRIDIPAHADDLKVVREHVGDPPCVIFGHSMGCQVALEEYRRYPDKVKGLVLICGTYGKVTATFKGTPILDLILPRLLDTVIKHEDMARAIWTRIPPEMALKIALRVGDIDPEKIRREDVLPYLKHMTHVDLPMFLKMLRAAGEHSAEDILPDVKVPTLVVAGEKDSFTPPFLAEAMAEAIPGAELVLIERGTHVASLEQHDFVDSRIAHFLRERVLT
jgi:pimeloyl-ACP methyl ester carboxylesterase